MLLSLKVGRCDHMNNLYQISKDEFFIEGCMLFDMPFIADGYILVIHELWKIMQQRTDCYDLYLSPYCINYFSTTNEPDNYLDITDIKFLDGIKKCDKFCLFFYDPVELQWGSETEFYMNPIYKQIEPKLKCLGYNVTGSQGSALTDGLYPIYLSDVISGKIVPSNTISHIQVNSFGLLNSFRDCLEVCKLNNESPLNDSDNIYWRPQKIFADLHTYDKLLGMLEK